MKFMEQPNLIMNRVITERDANPMKNWPRPLRAGKLSNWRFVLIVAATLGASAMPATAGQVVIQKIKPSSGRPGTVVTVSGSGFMPTSGHMPCAGCPPNPNDGNTVQLGSSIVGKNLNSADGITLQFQIPQNFASGTFSVQVTNANGKSNTVDFTVTKN